MRYVYAISLVVLFGGCAGEESKGQEQTMDAAVADANRGVQIDAAVVDARPDFMMITPADRGMAPADGGATDTAMSTTDGGPGSDATATNDMGPAVDAMVMTMCDPNEEPICEGWRQRVCRADGTGYELVSCEDGSVCYSGQCAVVRPNVVLILDTSGSMNQLIADGSDPAECEGNDCPPWDYPVCDDLMMPRTRLGRAKVAIRSVVNSDAAADVRLALQRFPQTEGVHPLPGAWAGCGGGWHSNRSEVPGHFNDAHSLERALLDERLDVFMPVPIGENGQTDVAGILRQTNFVEAVEGIDQACNIHRDCPGGFCQQTCRYVRNDELGECDNVLGWGVNTLGTCVEVSGCACDERCQGRVFESQAACQQSCGKVCHRHTEPEIQAVGATPIGQSLFYAGEYFRHFVVKEGLECAGDADCGSPDYVCTDGACTDPLAACRRNIVLVFSDGHETENDEPDNFFNPRVQAKRFHFGLGCAADPDCLNGARCADGVCLPPIPGLPQRVCLGTDRACLEDAECPVYRCGLGMPACPGRCEAAGFDYVDNEGFNVLRNPAGRPVSVTVHVVDASGEAEGNSLMALVGGGTHSSVDFADPEGLLQRLITLIGMKADADSCR